jgi:excisionase family DNA binding protein
MTPDEVAVALRVSLRFVYKSLAEGRLRAGRAGRRWLITEQNISDFLALGQQQPAQAGPDSVAAAGAGPARPDSTMLGRAAEKASALLTTGSVEPGPGGSPLANRKNKRHR